MKKRIYIDTSVYGGYFDKEFSADTIPFFEHIIRNKITVLVSELIEFEIYKAPEFVSNFYESIPIALIEKLEITDEVIYLADKYISEKVVGATSRADCQHIALATINNASVLASWNFKHIVNLERIRGYNSINMREGYQITEIRTPKEIFNYENE